MEEGEEVKNDGGLAENMTVRDVFMMAAIESGQCPFTCYEHEEVARWCGIRANAMIEERQRSDEISSNEK